MNRYRYNSITKAHTLLRSPLLFSHSVVSDSLQPHGLQHTRLLCPSLSLRVCSVSCSLSQWCYLTISTSVAPFSCPQSFFSIRVFSSESAPKNGGSASASVLPMNIQGWFPLRLIGLISLQFKGLSRVSSNTTVQKHQFFGAQPSLQSTLTSIHDYWKNHSFD